MSGAGFIQTLKHARDAGIVITAEHGELTVRPASRLTPGLQLALRSLVPELIDLLTWREDEAAAVVLDARAQLAEFYDFGDPGSKLKHLDFIRQAVDDALERRDMYALRLCAHEWARGGRRLYMAGQRS